MTPDRAQMIVEAWRNVATNDDGPPEVTIERSALAALIAAHDLMTRPSDDR
jgi:hypothetical protein